MTHYIPTIGLEIHAELKTKTKMFCGCKNDPFVKDPNIYVCSVCLGLPGALPVMNKQAVIDTILIGKAISGKIAEITKWDRKHYFYPDLPKGYQISQYDNPLITGGFIEVNNNKINVTRIHLEEDTGKLMHDTKNESSLVDLNRAGVPLVELVTEPDIKDAKTASAFAEEYQLLLRTLGVATADMEKGEMRVEVNISIAQEGQRGTKVEIKNLNSFKSVEKAIEYEITRQTKLLEEGQVVVQETRGWDMDRGTTISQRKKETAADYRYFPEPDLPPVDTTKLEIPPLPILPSQIKENLISKGIPVVDANIIVRRPQILAVLSKIDSQPAEIISAVAQLLVHTPSTQEKDPEELIRLAKLPVHQRKLALAGQEVGEELNEDELKATIQNILNVHASTVQEYKSGKTAAYGFLIGQVMKETKGQADPRLVNTIVKALLEA